MKNYCQCGYVFCEQCYPKQKSIKFMKVEIINWQDKGYFGQIWANDGKSAITVPHPNLDCPRELYKTKQECFDACEKKMNDILMENAPERPVREIVEQRED